MKKVGIKSIGHYAPAHILSNDDLSKMVDTNDEWIMSRTGIRERRIARDETTADMGTKAVQNCIPESERAGVDLLITSCGSPNNIYPTQSAQIANKASLPNAVVLDINIACTGLIAGMILAQSMIEAGRSKNAVIAATEKMTAYMDYTDRNNCVLFGDGASAIQLSADDYEHEIIATEMGSDSSGANMLTMGDRDTNGFFWQDGKNIYRFVQTKLPQLIASLKVKANLGDEPYYLVPHQANARMFEAIADKVGIPFERILLTIEKYGNTSSSSVGIALNEFADAGKFKKGDAVMLVAFGAGLAWAGAVIRW
jgi:3-oxoacyl-[acyl-carrier-protein] synthase-3